MLVAGGRRIEVLYAIRTVVLEALPATGVDIDRILKDAPMFSNVVSRATKNKGRQRDYKLMC